MEAKRTAPKKVSIFFKFLNNHLNKPIESKNKAARDITIKISSNNDIPVLTYIPKTNIYIKIPPIAKNDAVVYEYLINLRIELQTVS